MTDEYLGLLFSMYLGVVIGVLVARADKAHRGSGLAVTAGGFMVVIALVLLAKHLAWLP